MDERKTVHVSVSVTPEDGCLVPLIFSLPQIVNSEAFNDENVISRAIDDIHEAVVETCDCLNCPHSSFTLLDSDGIEYSLNSGSKRFRKKMFSILSLDEKASSSNKENAFRISFGSSPPSPKMSDNSNSSTSQQPDDEPSNHGPHHALPAGSVSRSSPEIKSVLRMPRHSALDANCLQRMESEDLPEDIHLPLYVIRTKNDLIKYNYQPSVFGASIPRKVNDIDRRNLEDLQWIKANLLSGISFGKCGKKHPNDVEPRTLLSNPNYTQLTIKGGRRVRHMPFHEITAVRLGKSSSELCKTTSLIQSDRSASLETQKRRLNIVLESPEDRNKLVHGIATLVKVPVYNEDGTIWKAIKNEEDD